MARSELILAALVVVSCSKERDVIETPINFVLDADDLEAKTRLAKIELEVWPATANACPTMSSWRTEMCGQEDCSPAPSPRDRNEDPEATAELVRDVFGVWSPLRLPAPTQGPWELVVRGLDVDGAVFLYGCKAVSADESWDIRMWRPWCDVEGLCRGLFHPACLIEIECVSTTPSSGGVEEVNASPVRCRALRTFESAWEEEGRTCPPRSGSYFAPCHMAQIACEPGRIQPVVDGVCPREVDLPCGADRSLDLDCDNESPGPCGQCDAGTSESCKREDGLCEGQSECRDGAWGPCVYAEIPDVEACDFLDNDCDGIGDDLDVDAIITCNRGHERNKPVADTCGRAGCSCGGSPPCQDSRVCRSGRCEVDAQPVDPIIFPDAGVAPDAETFPDADAPLDAEEKVEDAQAAPDASRRDMGLVRDTGT